MKAFKDARIDFKLAKEGWSNIHGENVKSLSTVHEYEGYVETVDNAIPRGFITREEFDRAYVDQDISVGELARQCLIFMAENGNATHASGIMNDAMRIRTFLAVMQEKGVSEAQALPSGYGDRKIASTFWYLDNGTDEPYHVSVGSECRPLKSYDQSRLILLQTRGKLTRSITSLQSKEPAWNMHRPMQCKALCAYR